MTSHAILPWADALVTDQRLPFDGFRIENSPDGALLVTHTLHGRPVFWHRYEGVRLDAQTVCTLEGIEGWVEVDPLS
ncbi:hypothetical protein [uncultured Pseudacidovorax sp.]|uniref:hypothetical protein n=1 Tax=uncultured Pseudacidovorax sp. TaxID=679313 RepID=UPI0025F8613A|nr:hypothetical protein [uncultured Pseudacidovorax sp.]